LSGTRQRKFAVTIPGDGDGDFAECHRDTLQKLTLCRLPTVVALDKEALVGPFVSSFAESIRRHSAKAPSLSSARRTSSRQREHQRAPLSVPLLSVKATSLGKEAFLVPRCAFFAECYGLDTRQSSSFSCVTLGKVTRIPFLFVFVVPSKQTKDISHNHHIYITVIIESSHTSNTRYSSQRSHVSSQRAHVSSQRHKYHKIVHNTNKYSYK
jgi:hypothetical protein